MSDHVYATFSTWVTPTVQILRGDIWPADDPVVRSHPDWFTADPEGAGLVRRSDQSVSAVPGAAREPETASAAPGELRTVQVPTKTDAAFDEMADLRRQAEALGIKVDKRWGLDRLREEIANHGG